jgi:16S rRNA (cytosine967-C5)-methyltransferase
MQNSGALIAADRDPTRLARLKQNLLQLGVQNCQCVDADWTNAEFSEGEFDRILIDAPCSNTGVMRRRVDVRWRLRPNDFCKMQQLQLQITRAVLPNLKRGGVFVYSTCSIEPEENAKVVELLLREQTDLVLEEMRSSHPAVDGIDGAFAARFRRIR